MSYLLAVLVLLCVVETDSEASYLCVTYSVVLDVASYETCYYEAVLEIFHDL